MNGEPDHPSAASYAKSQLTCREMREDLVALQRNELSPLRAESVRVHLVSCPECREESLELELAMRSFQKLPEVEPPEGLADGVVMEIERVLAGQGRVGRPSGVREHAAAAAEGGSLRRASVWFRPVRQSLAWAAVAAVVLLTAVAGFVEPFSEAVGRAQRKILGARISQVIDSATVAFLEKFRL